MKLGQEAIVNVVGQPRAMALDFEFLRHAICSAARFVNFGRLTMEPSNHVLELTIDPLLTLAFIWWTTIVGILNETDVVFDGQILPLVSSAVYDANLP